MVTEVEGGLDEPAELEPEQGSLALADAEDTTLRADWEKAAAAVLRKAGRLADDDPTTRSGTSSPGPRSTGSRSPPLGTPDLLDDLATERRPAGPATGTSAPTSTSPTQKQPTRPRWSTSKRRHLAVARGRRRPPTSTRPRRRAARPGAGRAGRPADPRPRPQAFLDATPATPPADGDQPGRRPDRTTPLGDRPELTSWPTLASHRSPRSPATSACAASSSTRTAVHDAGASDAQELGCSLAAGAAYLRALTDGRAGRRRGLRAAGVPLRRHRRPVHDHRQAARRPPAVGPGRRAVGAAGAPRPAPARRHLPADDDPVRPVGEHAAHHGRRLRRRRRRRRRGHRAAVRRRARRCPTRSPAGSPATPQSLLIEESHLAAGRRPGRRSGTPWSRSPTTSPRRPGPSSGRIERAGGVVGALGRRLAPGRIGRRPRPSGRAEIATRRAADHRRQRVPEPATRSCPSGRPCPAGARRRCRRTGRGRSRRCVTTPGRGAGLPGHASARSPRTPPGPAFAANLFAAGGIDTVDRRRDRRRRRRARGVHDGHDGRLPGGTDKAYAESGRRRRGRACGRPARPYVSLAGKPGAT